MRNYYFLATALPPLQIGSSPEISFGEFQDLIQDNLSAEDLEKAIVISRYYDILNIRAFLKDEPFDSHGNFNENELEEAMLTRQGLPEYVYTFVESNDSTQSRLENFSALTSAYFRNEAKKATGFLRDYLTFEHNWRLVFAGFRSKQLGRDLLKELQFEDPNDDIVAQILAQKDSKTFVPPDGYEDLKVIFDEYGDKPLELYQALCEYRFRYVEETIGIDVFSIEYILGYMVKLIALEKWLELDQQRGLEVINRALNEERKPEVRSQESEEEVRSQKPETRRM